MSASFDPAQHKRYKSRWFDDFKVGERFILPSRTMTDALFLAFQSASGDNHPIHYDVEYCRRRNMQHMLAHGYQVLIQTAAGAGEFPFMVEDSLIAFLDQSSRFLKPVFSGDTIYPAIEIAELSPNRSTGIVAMTSSVHNHKGELVMDGTQRYLVRKHPAA
jgi:acyl dehydratase